jgi:integrase
MARTPKPWFRKQTGWWMVTLGGVQHKLVEGRENKKAAQTKFHELSLLIAAAPQSSDARVADISEAFLQWSERHQSAETYRGYLFYVQSFCESAGFLSVQELRPFHVQRWLDSKPWNPTTQYNAVRGALRVFNWAVKQGLIEKSPLKGMERPRPKSRECYLTDAEFRLLRRAASRPFKLFLIALRLTGARPSEVRRLTWEQVRDDCWILGEHKTSGKVDKPRVVYLPHRMRVITAVLRRESTSKYVFVNCRGGQWTTNAVRLQMARLRKKVGLRENACVYEIRHAYGTYGLLNGVGAATLAELMGHVDTTMISRVYGHLADQHEHLLAAAARATLRPGKKQAGDAA